MTSLDELERLAQPAVTIHYFALAPEAQWAMVAVLAIVPFLAKQVGGRLWR